MRDSKLAGLLEHLTGQERAVLSFAASARGDEVEHRRLLSSAPIKNQPIPDGFFEVMAVATTGLQFAHYQMQLVASFLIAMLHVSGAQKGEDQDRLVLSSGLVRAAAYAFVTEREGWRQFCEELGLDPAHLCDDESRNPQLALAEPMMEEMAYTAEEMAAWIARAAEADDHDVPPSINRPDGVAAAWRTIYEGTLCPA